MMLKKTIILVYLLLILCMGIATVVEKMYGTDYADTNIYGSWWFVTLWAVLAACSLVYLTRRRLSPAVLMIHISFAGILSGAFVTYLTAQRGTVHLRTDKEVSAFYDKEQICHSLPFTLHLDEFHVENYPGTNAPLDYVCRVSVHGTSQSDKQLSISMNKVGEVDGYRFYQSSYDEDLEGTHLLVSHDPYGIAVTYTSYIMLLLSIIATFITKIRKKILMAILLAAAPFSGSFAATGPSVEPAIAHDLAKVAVLYNNRICPLNTAATDFVQKLAGKPSWQGLSADEVFVGWMIYYDYWEHQPIIRIKNSEVQRFIGINDSWASLRDFYSLSNEYKLQKYLNDASLSESTRKAVREADEKVRIISMFYAGEFTKIFPLNNDWYSPGSTSLPKDTPTKEFLFIKHVMDQVVEASLTSDAERAHTLISKIRNYQKEHAPIPSTMGLEVFYNTFIAMRIPIMVFLTLSLILCLITFMKQGIEERNRVMKYTQHTLHIAIFLYTTLSLSMRWAVSGHVPLSNGFETMQFMAWATITMTMILRHRMPLLTPLGPVVSSFALLVSMIACGSPQLTPLMPVLQSPLLTIHVMVIMLAYALFTILAVLSLQAIFFIHTQEGEYKITTISRQLLFPAVALLAIGIFIGAVWANVSWGRYWGWDPKETWALITLMIYAIPLHRSFFPYSNRTYHIFIASAFLAVLMTYFGVNYLLPGMHSYA